MVYPFLQTTEDLILGRTSRLRCGCGYANYTIMTDGHIGPCPVMTGMRDYYIGHIRTADPLALQEIGLRGSCPECDIFGFCGGRCLYADALRPWSPEEKELVCSAVYTLREGLMGVFPRIRKCIKSGRISLRMIFPTPVITDAEFILPESCLFVVWDTPVDTFSTVDLFDKDEPDQAGGEMSSGKAITQGRHVWLLQGRGPAVRR